MRLLTKPLAAVVTLGCLFASTSAMAQTAVAVQPPPVTPVVVVTPPPAPAPEPKAVPKNFINYLAKASLAKQGIAQPTPAQLAAERKSIADQRAAGKGWGAIAQSLGLNLGKVISSANHARHDARKEQHAQSKHQKRDGEKHEAHAERKTAEHSAGGEHGGSGQGGGNHGGGKGK
jgi:hypothetical protein